ncbi:MAG: hypothetical protein KatS3mg131_1506 [Candidatus Tectimicrobiota bacterium]|nr:MAG: hypothetical protein KatS3mg131_1506 [Candidatus Tectomicrobia bacterium]
MRQRDGTKPARPFLSAAGSALLHLGVVYLLAALLLGIFLSQYALFWLAYPETAIGARYVAMHGGLPRLARFVGQHRLFPLTLITTGLALATTLALAGLSQLLRLRQALYDGATGPFRLLLWGGLATLATARLLTLLYALPLAEAAKLACLPCFLGVSASFGATARLLGGGHTPPLKAPRPPPAYDPDLPLPPW